MGLELQNETYFAGFLPGSTRPRGWLRLGGFGCVVGRNSRSNVETWLPISGRIPKQLLDPGYDFRLLGTPSRSGPVECQIPSVLCRLSACRTCRQHGHTDNGKDEADAPDAF